MTTTVNALSKILVILKSTGCFPFYSYVNNYRLKQSRKFYKSYSLGIFLITQIIASFFLYAAIADCPFWFPYKYKQSSDSTNQLFEVILCVTVYALMQLLCVFNFSRFIEILNAILDIELDLKQKFRRELTNRKLEAYNTVILIYIVAVIIFMVVITAERITRNSNNATFILYMFQMAMSASYVVFFTSLVKLTVVRLKVVNTLFKSVSETPDDDLKLFFQVVEIYKLVEKTFGMIDDSNGLILLFYSAYVFYTLTNEIYSFAFLILQQHGEMWNYTASVLWIVHQVWVLWELSMNCGVVPDEAKKTAQILARVYGKGKDYQNMIDKFLTKSIKQEIKFTAYGFFVIDNSTLFKIVSAVTTYLVILIQFKQLEESKASSAPSNETTTESG